ncbi:peptidylprolyl isomerase [Desulfovibrio inopinatus]|uniref:peptidylprolyl isomerase n=1 Tax=Desulfovibrio inopinatus TaxID=102109 RepID=UPI000410D2A7|nr:SurA N-terminal domain-containing protein [Desulfovibrio inopinatus]
MTRKCLSILFLIFLVSNVSCFAQDVVDKVVAVVNGEIVTLFEVDQMMDVYLKQAKKKSSDLDAATKHNLRQKILMNLIDDILLRQEAERYGIKVTEKDIRTHIREFQKSKNLTDSQFEVALRQQGLTRQEYEKSLKRELVKKQLLAFQVNRKVVVTDEELASFKETGAPIPTAAATPSNTKAIGLIMVSDAATVNSIAQRIASGSLTFSQAAKQYSSGPGAAQGGHLGNITIGDLAPQLQKALSSVSPGEISEPVQMEGKYILLTYLDSNVTTDAPQLSVDQMANKQLYEMLYKTKLEKRFHEYLEQLRTRAVIKIRLDE